MFPRHNSDFFRHNFDSKTKTNKGPSRNRYLVYTLSLIVSPNKTTIIREKSSNPAIFVLREIINQTKKRFFLKRYILSKEIALIKALLLRF